MNDETRPDQHDDARPGDPVEDEQESKSGPKVVAGYKARDLLKTPLSAPDPVDVEPPETTSNRKVKSLVLAGIILTVIGIIFVLFVSTMAGMLVLLLAAAVVMVGVFAPIQ